MTGLCVQTSQYLGVRGKNELRRYSTCYIARPVLRILGRTVPLGEWWDVVEVIHEMPTTRVPLQDADV